MTLELTRHCFTTADYHRMGDAGILGEDDRVELIEGEIFTMSPIGGPHYADVIRLNELFVELFGRRARVAVQSSVILGDRSEPQPDLLVLRPAADYYRSGPPRAADVFLLVEVSDSSLAFDRKIKIPLYARYAISEVWLVDVAGESITVYRDPMPSGYSSIRTAHRGESLPIQAFPGREIAVVDILG
jgi:Uma2 family endonuclease